jgi:deoxyribodipyrimidine photo-lyase
MTNTTPITLFWFRRDLRLNDNAGLYHALKENENVLPLFIFDSNILDKLSNKSDKRVQFIHNALSTLNRELKKLGSSLLVEYGAPLEIYKQLTEKFNIKKVYTNHDYEPYALNRDKSIKEFLQNKNISFHSFKDQVIFEKTEVVKDDNLPYTVFTPYSKKWKQKLNAFYVKPYPNEKHLGRFLQNQNLQFLSLAQIGFEFVHVHTPSIQLNESVIANYAETRDIPGIDGTSKLSVHLRFGTVSIRYLVARAIQLNDKWLNELIWREFYMMILDHFPQVVNTSFKSQYEMIKWRNNVEEFEAWCKGQTGYPIVDAGMRELNETGYMHNRVRMIVASFLTKHLLIDWRWGEHYFAEKLLDFDLAANNGGWQWAAGSGCDAAPYFRVFSPYEQTKKIDAHFVYIKKWVPEFQELNYPPPVVDHKMARLRVLVVYKEALSSK